LAHHVMMRKYGWIPLEEFKKLPLPTFWSLLECLKKEFEEEKKNFDRMKRRR